MSERLRQHVTNSATLMLFLSKNYLASPWCRDEMIEFLSACRDHRNAPQRVFVIRLEDIDQEEWPAFLRTSSGEPLGYGYDFFDQEGENSKPLYPYTELDRLSPIFHTRLGRLAKELAAELRALAGFGKTPRFQAI